MRGSISAFVLSGVGVGSIFLLHLVVARTLGPRGYGVFSYAFALANLLAAFAVLGWPTALRRFVAQYVELREWALLRGVLLHSLRVVGAVALLLAAVALAISLLPGVRVDLASGIRYAALLLPFFAYGRLRNSAFFGIHHIAKGIAFDQVLLPLATALLVFSCDLSLRGSILAYALVSLATMIGGTLWLIGVLPPRTKQSRARFEFTLWRRVALAMASANVAQIMLARADVLLLGMMSGPVSVGIYAASKRFANLGTFTLGAVATAAAPSFSAAFHGGRHDELRRLLKISTWWSILGGVPFVLVMLLLPEAVLGILGHRYIAGSMALQVLAIGQLFGAATGPVGSALLMSGRERVYARIALSMSLLDLVALLLGIHLYGYLGAALATSGTQILKNGWTLREARRAFSDRAHLDATRHE